MSKRATTEARVEVVCARPALMRDRDAAAYLARSVSWIRQARSQDLKTLRDGGDPSGPKWITIGASVFYELAELDRWITSKAVARGSIVFSNRGGSKP